MDYYMTIFDYYDFSIKDNIPIYNKNINTDEETNAVATVQTTHYANAKKRDIVVIKEGYKIIYWGIIKEISQEEEEKSYTYFLRYITNLFDEKVLLEQNVIGNIEEGYYRLKPVVDGTKALKVKNDGVENNDKVILWDKNSSESQIWKINKTGQHYNIKNANSDKYMNVADNAATTNGKDIVQNQTALNWDIKEKASGQYNIAYAGNNTYVVDVEDGVSANGTKIQVWENSQINEGNRLFYLEQTVEPIIWEIGIEDFIEKTIIDNFINNSDTFVNFPYLEIEVKTHSKKNVSVDNVENGIYNLHTFINNCTQNYNIMFSFEIIGKKLKMTIENKTMNRRLINEEMMTDVQEVFETDITSKVVVVTNSGLYKLYLLNDRTTTTDPLNPNRAKGKTETIYTENMEDAEQSALNVINQNSYNHNITFKSKLDLKVGQPISIRTKNSTIFDTYISAKIIAEEDFKQYTCGNIRINFIDKILKERNK